MTAGGSWDHAVDVLVVGSGNGGMTAALCAHEMGAGKVLLIEKHDKYGGTSAISGGGVWVPCNRYARAAGARGFARGRAALPRGHGAGGIGAARDAGDLRRQRAAHDRLPARAHARALRHAAAVPRLLLDAAGRAHRAPLDGARTAHEVRARRRGGEPRRHAPHDVDVQPLRDHAGRGARLHRAAAGLVEARRDAGDQLGARPAVAAEMGPLAAHLHGLRGYRAPAGSR